MRVLMWLTLGFAGACGATVYLLGGAVPLWTVAAALALAGILAALKRQKVCRLAAVAMAGCALGFCWYMLYDSLFLGDIRAYDGQQVELVITAGDYSFENDYGIVIDGVTELGGKRCRVRAYVNEQAALAPGSQVQGTFRLRYTAQGGQETATYHRAEGTFLLAYPKSEMQLLPAEEKQPKYLPAYLRKTLLDTIQAVFPEDTAAFAGALLLGESSGLDYTTDTAFSLSGIRHVVAVSGLHVSILFSLVYFLTGRRRFWSALVGIPVLFLFAAMAGFTPSIVRACLMQLLMLLAAVFSKEYDPPTGLSFAVFVMLVGNPQTITSVGFQLSAVSVAGIFLFYPRLRDWFAARLDHIKGWKGRLLQGLYASVSVSLSAMVLTTPLTAAYFGTVSLVGPLTNLLTLWVISFIFCGIILVCVLGLLLLPLGQAVAWVIAWPIRFVTGVAGFLGSLPLAAVYTESSYVVCWLVFCYVLLAVFLLSSRKQPFLLLCCMIVGLCASLLASWLEPINRTWQMTVLDVGQGQCIILESGTSAFMVDCGGSRDEETADLAAATLYSRGITRLDGVILTHYDRDHVGGAGYLLSRVKTDGLYLPAGEDTEDIAPELRELDGTPVTEDLVFLLEGAKLTIFAPEEMKSDNESSLCVLFQAENCDILITGDRSLDGERALVRHTALPDLEILVAGHHGSANSTSELLLRATRPETVVISVDEDNRYGHPSEALLQRLERYGCAVRRTDEEGTIILWG